MGMDSANSSLVLFYTLILLLLLNLFLIFSYSFPIRDILEFRLKELRCGIGKKDELSDF
jgi:hypothetical protein